MSEWGEDDRRFMRLAMDLASLGVGFTSPNPSVGAVVVKKGRIVGVGYHKEKGRDHAEVLALKDAGDHARGATMYVTLEPHQFTGAVPPCTDAILEAGIERIVIAVEDPNPKVKGKGIEALREKGIKVEVGLLNQEAREMNAPYFKVMEKGSSFVTLKLALTLDGFIADSWGNSKWITGEVARREVHRMRGEVDALLVGVGTVIRDDPLLTPREFHPARTPLRIILDPTLRTPLGSALLKEKRGCIFVTTKRAEEKKRISLEGLGSKVWVLGEDRIHLEDLLRKTALMGLHHILVEGGAGVASSFLQEGLVDRLVLIYSPRILGRGISPFRGISPLTLNQSANFRTTDVKVLGDDVMFFLEPEKREES